MKTQLIILAAILITSLTVSAKNNTTPDLVPTNSVDISTVEYEAPLDVEAWMTDDEQWTSKSKEKALSVEKWMTDDELWTSSPKKSAVVIEIQLENSNYIFVTVKKAKEQPLKIEDWMTDDAAWTM